MSSRRAFLKTSLLAGAVGLAGMPRWRADALAAFGAGAKAPREFTRHVDVFIGTGGHGHTYPGATVPFGMVQFSPEATPLPGSRHLIAAPGGYEYRANQVRGFSLTNVEGWGCAGSPFSHSSTL